MNGNRAIESKAAELRRAFDQSFALPPAQTSQEVEDLLVIRVMGVVYAIRFRDIAGMVAGGKVVSVPCTTPDFLGLASIRGGIVPVFGLPSILGHGRMPDSPRWMLLCGANEPIALGFSEFEGHLRIPRSDLRADENPRSPSQYVREIARTDAGVLAVISVPLVVTAIRSRISPGRLAKEP